MSRKIADLTLSCQELFMTFAAKMAERGIPFMLTCTHRTQEEQDELYKQGRTKSGKVVTWTRSSIHTKRRAFDIAILKDGQPTWDIKVSVNDNDVPDYTEAGIIGESIGLIWGGKFKDNKGKPKPDYPHFQLGI